MLRLLTSPTSTLSGSGSSTAARDETNISVRGWRTRCCQLVLSERPQQRVAKPQCKDRSAAESCSYLGGCRGCMGKTAVDDNTGPAPPPH